MAEDAPFAEHRPVISRVNRSKADAAASYDRLSGYYDCIASSERPFRDGALRVLNAQKGERILEVGFGTGRALVELARGVGPEGSVVGVDISTGMANVARAHLEQADLINRVELCIGDALDVTKSFEENQFDAVFVSFTLELFDTPEIPALLGELRRSLKGQGRLVTVSLSKEGGSCPIRVYEWFHKRLPSVADCRPIYAATVLKESGFSVDKVMKASLWGLTVDTILATIC